MIGAVSVRPIGYIIDIWDNVLEPFDQDKRNISIENEAIQEKGMRTMMRQSVWRKKKG